MSRRAGIVVAALLALGCGKSADDKAAKTASPPDNATVAEEKAAAGAGEHDENDEPGKPADSAGEARSPIPGVLGITAGPATPEARAQADALNREGLGLHRKGDLDAAMAAYRRALDADPSHRFARYNLASALVTRGEPDDALAILAEFAELGCQECLERLRRARQDGEWKPLWDAPRFQRLTDLGPQGPVASVAAFALVSPTSGGYEHRFAARIALEPPPGWARAPALALHIEAAGKQIPRRELASSDIDTRWIEEVFETPGRPFSVTLLVDGKPFGTLRARPEEMEPDSYPRPIIRNVRRPRSVARCDGTECPSFPALSPDGRYLAARDEWEAAAPGHVCNPPIVTLTSYRKLDDQDWGPSRDLTGWEPLDCDGDRLRLRDGFVAARDAAMGAIVIKNARGKIVARTDAYGSAQDLCVSRKHRVVIVRINEGVGSDCDEVPDYHYRALTY